ncbi:MAG: DUF6033 family protein [Eubacterium sp.]|nr:DUF6033 family protein [Eubacterium sp.]
MTQINGFSAYQNHMMDAMNQKKKADAEKTAKKAEEQEKIRAARGKNAEKTDKADQTVDKDVKLSEKAKALLEELKSKYGNMDFFIADYSTDEEAQKYLSRGTKEFSVLIDPATLEAMAADEDTKAKYTDMIDKATAQLADIKDQLEEDEGTEVKRIGITFNDDGTMSMFAELEQISERRREAIAKEREARAAEAKKADKKADEKADEKKAELDEEQKAEAEKKIQEKFAAYGDRPDEKVKRTIVSANTVEDLIAQIKGVNWDEIKAVDNKPPVGGHFDFQM